MYGFSGREVIIVLAPRTSRGARQGPSAVPAASTGASSSLPKDRTRSAPEGPQRHVSAPSAQSRELAPRRRLSAPIVGTSSTKARCRARRERRGSPEGFHRALEKSCFCPIDRCDEPRGSRAHRLPESATPSRACWFARRPRDRVTIIPRDRRWSLPTSGRRRIATTTPAFCVRCLAFCAGEPPMRLSMAPTTGRKATSSRPRSGSHIFTGAGHDKALAWCSSHHDQPTLAAASWASGVQRDTSRIVEEELHKTHGIHEDAKACLAGIGHNSCTVRSAARPAISREEISVERYRLPNGIGALPAASTSS